MVHEPISRKTYTVVFVILMVLLVVSIFAAQIETGPVMHFLLGFGISVVKAILIVLYFMHLIHSSAIIRLVAGGALLWLVFALVLTFSDYLTRGWHTSMPPGFVMEERPTSSDRSPRPGNH